jgi:hypothetical protein
MPTRKMIVVLFALACLVVPAVALAAPPSRPAAGRWKIDSKHGFHVTKNRKFVYGFKIPGATCASSTIHVLHQQRLHRTTAGGVTNWLVGRGDPKRTNPHDQSGVVPALVKVRVGKKLKYARLSFIFGVDGNKRDNSGELEISDCFIPLFAHHA